MQFLASFELVTNSSCISSTFLTCHKMLRVAEVGNAFRHINSTQCLGICMRFLKGRPQGSWTMANSCQLEHGVGKCHT